ncbi:MAG: long-chain fatty acid--CoA ligase [Bryobacterales bacterium]|nr:long-chain fatty acid--CoA ligase [Bryobacterales bacterium]
MTSRTMFQVLEQAASTWQDQPALHQPLGKGEYQVYSWTQYRDAAREIACGLRVLGLGHGDVIALDSETRAEFYLADLGIMGNGSIAAALYTSYPPQELVQTLRHAEAKAVFVEDLKTLCALQEAASPPLEAHWILLTGEGEGAFSLAQLRELGRAAMEREPGFFEGIHAQVQPEDHAILYMTSGATGEPKMCLVSHRALVANVDMGPVVLPLGLGDTTIVFLPSAHIAQRVVIELLPIRMGLPVWFSEGLSKLPLELKTIAPTFFLAPPRVWERMHASIATEVRKRPMLAQKLFAGALGLGFEVARRRQQGRQVPAVMQAGLKLADRLVFSKIRQRLGGRMRIAASGAAPLGKHLADFYAAIGMPLTEGFGLTEGGIVALNPPGNPRTGSVGKALPGVRWKLTEEGELLLQSPTLFSGYYHDSEATAAVMREGWLHTGDLAEIDQDGYLYITGRKKEIIVSSNGKKVYPSRVESLFKPEPIVNQVVLIGDDRPYVTALFTLNAPVAETLKGVSRATYPSQAELFESAPVQKELRQAVERVNRQLAPFEQIRKFKVVARDFSIEEGEITPTMKIRRARVLDNCRHQIQEMYAGKPVP